MKAESGVIANIATFALNAVVNSRPTKNIAGNLRSEGYELCIQMKN